MIATNANYTSFRHRRIEFTKHARARSQQRCIGADSVPLIRAFGEREHDGRGGVRYLMTAAAVARVARSLGYTKQLDRLEGVYVVLDAETELTVITLGHRHA